MQLSEISDLEALASRDNYFGFGMLKASSHVSSSASGAAVAQDDDPALPAVKWRPAEQHTALIEELQTEFAADDLGPPVRAHGWSDTKLRCWFEGGGNFELSAVKREKTITADEVGCSLRVVSLPPCAEFFDGGALGVVRRRNDAPFAHLASLLAANSHATFRLGASLRVYEQADSVYRNRLAL